MLTFVTSKVQLESQDCFYFSSGRMFGVLSIYNIIKIYSAHLTYLRISVPLWSFSSRFLWKSVVLPHIFSECLLEEVTSSEVKL